MSEPGLEEVVGALEVEALPQRPPRKRKRARAAACDAAQGEHAAPEQQEDATTMEGLSKSPREPEPCASADQPDIPDGATYECACEPGAGLQFWRGFAALALSVCDMVCLTPWARP